MTKKILVFGLAFIFSVSVFAKEETLVAPSFELFSAGKINRCPIYQLKLHNYNNESYQILIKDKFGDILYEEFLSGKEVVRNYMINIYELGNTPVFIEIINSSGFLLKKFSPSGY